MDPDIKLQIEVDVMGMENIKRLQTSMSGLLGMQDRLAKSNGATVTTWGKLRDALDAIEQKYDAVFRAGFRLQNLGADLTRMGQAGVGVLKESVSQWGDFEFALNRAAGSLSIWETTTPIYEDLKQAIYEVAQEARIFPAEDIARATYYWGSTTGQVVETEEDLKVVMEGLLPIMKAAAITETDYEAAIKGVYSILMQYGMGLGATRDVTEKLMLITQRTAAEFPDLINSFKMVGPIADSLGISFDEVVKYVGLIADAGIRGTMSGRALRQTFVKLVDPTIKARNALDAVMETTYGTGETFDSIMFPEGEFIGFTQYVRILADVMEDMDMKTKNNLLGIITTQNELPVLTALINQQIDARKDNVDAIDNEKFSLANAHEQFEKTFDLLKNSWQGVVGLWQNSVIPIIHLIGAEISKLLAPVMEFFSGVMQQVYKFLQANPMITEWIVKLIALGSAALLVAGAFFSVLGTLFVFAAGVGLAIESMVEVVKLIGGFIGKMGIAAGWLGLFTLIMVTNFGGIRDAVLGLMGVFGGFVSWLGGIIQQAQRTFEFLFSAVGLAIGILDEFFRSLGRINFSSDTFWDIGIVVEFIAGAMQGAIGTILGVAVAMMTAVKVFGIVKAALLGVKVAWLAMLALKKPIMLFAATVKAFAMVHVGLGVVTTALGILRAAMIAAFVSNPVGATIAVIILAIGALVIAFRSAGDVINNFAMDFGDMGNTLHEVADETGRDYQAIKDDVQEAMREHGLSFDEAIERTRALSTETQYVAANMGGVPPAVDAVSESMGGMDQATANAIAEMEAAGMEIPAEMLAMEGSVTGSVDAIGDAIDAADWANSIQGQLAIAAQKGRTEARRIPSEIAAGILEGRNDVVNAAKGLADAATYELMNEARVGELRTEMDKATAAIQEAIVAGTPGAVAAANAEYIALELELAGYLLTIDPLSAEAAGILEKYITSSDPATQAAAEALYGALEDRAFIAEHNIEQYAVDMGIAPENALKLFKAGAILQSTLMASGIEKPIETLVGDLQTHGEDAISGLTTAIEDNAYLASTATGEVKKEAESNLILLRDIAEQYGIDTSDAYAEGIRRGAYNAFLAGAEVAAQARLAFEAHSPPVATSPLHHIDDWGLATVIAWADGIRKGGSYAYRMAKEVVAGVRNPFTQGMDAMAFETTSGHYSSSFDRTDRKVVDINVNVTSTDGSVSDQNAGTIGDAIHKGLLIDRMEHLVRIT